MATPNKCILFPIVTCKNTTTINKKKYRNQLFISSLLFKFILFFFLSVRYNAHIP